MKNPFPSLRSLSVLCIAVLMSTIGLVTQASAAPDNAMAALKSAERLNKLFQEMPVTMPTSEIVAINDRMTAMLESRAAHTGAKLADECDPCPEGYDPLVDPENPGEWKLPMFLPKPWDPPECQIIYEQACEKAWSEFLTCQNTARPSGVCPNCYEAFVIDECWIAYALKYFLARQSYLDCCESHSMIIGPNGLDHTLFVGGNSDNQPNVYKFPTSASTSANPFTGRLAA